MTDVVADIDALIAEEICPKCENPWHEQPLTEALLTMFTSGEINAYFFGGIDESPILCEGSSFIGPKRPNPRQGVDISDPPPFAEDVQWTSSWSVSFDGLVKEMAGVITLVDGIIPDIVASPAKACGKTPMSWVAEAYDIPESMLIKQNPLFGTTMHAQLWKAGT